MSSRNLSLMALLILGLSACMGQLSKQNGGSPKAPVVASSRSLEEIQADIDDLTSDLACDNNTQCNLAQYGVQRCGGPTHLQLYSTKTVQQSQLFQLTSEYNSVNQKLNAQNPGVGACALLDVPSVVCSPANQCAEVP